MSITSTSPPSTAWRILAESITLGVVAYVAAGATEMGVIRIFQPTEAELAWVSDAVLATALGVAVYLWRHLAVTRAALLDRERAELVLTTQLAVAADLQRRLLPTLPAGRTDVEWAAALRSAGQIGGDFYDLVSFADGRTMLLAADVSGKGIPAAMALSTLRAAFRAFALPDHSPAHVLTDISTTLHYQWAGAPYLTGIVALVDVAGGALHYASAAHPEALVVGPTGARRLEALDPPAALFAGHVFHERTVPLGPGDRCVFVSDGVTEALGAEAGSTIDHIVRGHAAAPGRAAALCDALMAAAMAAPGPEGVDDWDDDRTVVVLSVLNAPGVVRSTEAASSGTLALLATL